MVLTVSTPAATALSAPIAPAAIATELNIIYSMSKQICPASSSIPSNDTFYDSTQSEGTRGSSIQRNKT